MASLTRSTLVMLAASLAGGVFGWVVVGPVVHGMLEGEIEWPTTQPMSGNGAIAGFVLGAVIGGGNRRWLKWALVIGTSVGLTLGSRLEDYLGHLSLPWGMIGTLVGMTLGIVVGIIMERTSQSRNGQPS